MIMRIMDQSLLKEIVNKYGTDVVLEEILNIIKEKAQEKNPGTIYPQWIPILEKCSNDLKQSLENLVKAKLAINTNQIPSDLSKLSISNDLKQSLENFVKAKLGINTNQIPSDLTKLSIHDLAIMIVNDWKKMSLAARPYCDAMQAFDNINDNYFLDSGREIVSRFLCNATTWKGEVARSVKKELNRRIKGK